MDFITKTVYLLKERNCSTKLKILVLDAVVKSKLIYGIDSLHLNEPELQKLERFHLQTMRKMLELHSTFINRVNINEDTYET